MRVICEKDKITSTVFGVARAVSNKPAMPVLEGIYINAVGNTATFVGYDLSIAIKSTIDAEIKEEGSIIINAKIFSDFLRKADSDFVTIATDEKNNVKLNAGNAEFSIVGMNAAEYPEVPDVKDGKSVTMDYELFSQMVNQTSFACAIEDNNQLFKGVNFEFSENMIKLVGLDGKRLAVRKEKVKNSDNISFIVPSKTLSELLRLIEESEKITIILDKHHVSFKAGDFYVVSRLIYGDYIKYEQIIPTESEIDLKINVREFINAIERVSLMMTERLKSPIRLELEGNKISFRCISDLGVAIDSIACNNTSGKNIVIGFNNKYMLDALKATDCDEVRIEFISNIKPIKITPLESDDFLYLVLPVQIALTEQQ